MQRLRISLLAALTVGGLMTFGAGTVLAQPDKAPDPEKKAGGDGDQPPDGAKDGAKPDGTGDKASGPDGSGSMGASGEPTAEDIEKAREAFLEGHRLFNAKDFENAVKKFKEAYRLSKNPLLLYNIGFTLDKKQDIDLALFYYEKFLTDAGPKAQVYDEVNKRVKAIKKAKEAGKAFDSGSMGKIDDGKPKVTEFMHKVVEETPPGKPLDLTAFVPEASGWQVTLFFRAAGEERFSSTIMRPRYNELVGRIPASKTGGKTLQYYIEVRDKAGKIVSRSGRSASPNLVFIDPKAQPRYYPDLTQDRDWDGAQDPNTNIITTPDPVGKPGDGFTDVGSSKFRYVKWGTTGAAIGLIASYAVFHVSAVRYSDSMEREVEESLNSSNCANPPCRSFSEFQKDLERVGKRYELISRVSMVTGIAAAGVAGYFWYKEFTQKRRDRRRAAAAGKSDNGVTAVPVMGHDFVGGAALLRF